VSARDTPVQESEQAPRSKSRIWLGKSDSALFERIKHKAERRVLAGEAGASGEKLVSRLRSTPRSSSLAAREVHYGYKLNLDHGKSG